MLTQNPRLRLDSRDGSPASEYRILDDGIVEVRTVVSEDGSESPRSAWRPLTPDQLSSHVERNTVVAQWLERRMGWRPLLLACVGEGWWSECGGSESDSSDARIAS
jgi:hypothetical protein